MTPKLSRFLLASLSFATLTPIVLTTAVPAEATLVSASKHMRIDWQYVLNRSTCSTQKPHGRYTVRGGVTGLLYPANCTENLQGGDSASYEFVDVSGKERCIGRMELLDGGRATKTIWYIDRAVDGFPCSVAGQKFEIDLFYTR
ncbi:hypothetical protein ACQ4M5_24230 [Leptolyngbya sp. AN10]